MTLEQEKLQNADLLILLTSTDPTLLRDAYTTAESARQKGHTAVVLEVESRESAEEIAALIEDRSPVLVAAGVTSGSLGRVLKFTAEVMRRRLSPLVIFGSDMAMEHERRAVPVEAATGVVVGDPTGPVVDYLRVLTNGVKRPVAGLDLLDGDYRPRRPDNTAFSVPYPEFREADYVRLRRDGLPIRMSIGCPRRCVHCTEQPRQGKYRARPAHEVVQEMFFHYENHNVRRFRFVDLVINGDLAHLEAVCDLLMVRDDVQLEWWGQAMVDAAMPRALYRKMRLAGCIGLHFDVFSGSDRILGTLAAGFTADDATRAVTWASDAGINVSLSLMVGAPGEAELEFGETVAWLYKNRFSIGQIVDVLPCELTEGTVLRRNFTEYAVTLPAEDPEKNWHNGGFNTLAYRNKRTRELRTYIEDKLNLEITGRSLTVPWDEETRERMVDRVHDEGEIALANTGRFKRENKHLAGAYRGKRAFGGPIRLEIDLTNRCNQRCAGCWIHSDMLGDKRISGEKRRATLSFEVVEKLVRDAKAMGTKHIQLSGAGDPFMHPQINEILALIKDAGIECNVITNFTMMDDGRARMLVDLGVDSVTVSLWAGTPETYVKTHPTSRESTFIKLVEVVSHLTWYRRQTGASRPRVKIYNVISSLNAHEINEMITVAREMGADLIEFTPIDILPGYTDQLALSKEDTQRIIDDLMNVRHRSDYLQRTLEEIDQGRLPGTDEQGEYARFLQAHRLAGDFRFSLADIRRWEAYCRRGVHCNRVYEEIHRDSAIFFGFPKEECRGCMAYPDCSVDPIGFHVRAPYLSLQGFGSFWRRVAGAAEGKRDDQIVDTIPCSIGYTYARVQATGHVIPCCKGTDFPLGNIFDNSFEEIWYSQPYEEFRQKALVTPKSDPYFAPMECYKVCDNLGHNMQTRDALAGLHPRCRDVLDEEG